MRVIASTSTKLTPTTIPAISPIEGERMEPALPPAIGPSPSEPIPLGVGTCEYIVSLTGLLVTLSFPLRTVVAAAPPAVFLDLGSKNWGTRVARDFGGVFAAASTQTPVPLPDGSIPTKFSGQQKKPP
jgi:hypothetical protein